MSTPTKEEIYDTEIAPRLLEIGELCQERGLGFSAAVEYEPFGLGRTLALPGKSSIAIRMVDAAVQAHGNLDSFLRAVIKHAHQHGHESVYLTILGVPAKPQHGEENEAR